MARGLKNFLITALGSARDLAPIVLVIAFFQVFVVHAPLEGWFGLLTGGLTVLIGLLSLIHI